MVGFGCLYLDQNISEQKQACKKHELYVSFRELGWQVRGMFQKKTKMSINFLYFKMLLS